MRVLIFIVLMTLNQNLFAGTCVLTWVASPSAQNANGALTYNVYKNNKPLKNNIADLKYETECKEGDYFNVTAFWNGIESDKTPAAGWPVKPGKLLLQKNVSE